MGEAVQVTALGGGGGQFTGVSCPSAGNCTAVGFTYTGSYDVHGDAEIGYPIYERETAGKWGPVRELTIPPGAYSSAGGASFSSVSCSSATSCTAVGTGPLGAEPMFATESGGTFGPANFVTTPTGSGFFASVSCTSAADCTAVGGDTNEFFGGWDVYKPIYATESAGTWGTALEIDAPASGGFFNAVSCPSAPTCTAVGGQTAVTEAAGSWGTAKKIANDGVSLYGIDCSLSADCTAVGESSSDAFGTIEYVSIHVTEKAGVWGSAKADGGGDFSNVSCRSATTCTSVGSFDLCTGVSLCNSSSVYPVYASEHAGIWPAVPRPPNIMRVTPLDGRATVAWTVSKVHGGPAVVGYTAIAVLKTDNGASEFTCVSTRTRCTIAELTDGKTYTISVIARNAVGSSVTSSTRRTTPHA